MGKSIIRGNSEIALLTEMLDHVTDLVFLMEYKQEEFIYRFINKKARAVLDLNDTTLGHSILAIHTPQKALPLHEAYMRVVSSEAPISFRQQVVTASGEFTGESILSPLFNEQHEITHILGIVQDVSALYQQEELFAKELNHVLEQKNRELETLWNTAINPIFQLNLDGTMLRVNPAFCQLFEYEEHELAHTMRKIIPDFLEDEMNALQERLDRFESIESYETQRITKSGKIVDILASYTTIFDESGQPIAIHVVYNNITSLKNIQRELDQSKEKYKVITEHAFDVIKVFNRNGRVDYFSPSVRELLGYEPTECLGQRFTTFVHPDDQLSVQHHIQQLIQTRKHFTMEMRLRHKKGHFIWMEVVASPVIERGRVMNIITISRDISERHDLQETLKQMAYYDHLSGLPNRRAFDDALQEMLTERELSEGLAVILVDGNQFKMINDTLGHDAGDAVITELAKRLSTSVRSEDLVARLGGDEFGVVLTKQNSREKVEEIVARIAHAFAPEFLYQQHAISIEIAIGIARFPTDAIDKKALYIAADNALYESKKHKITAYTFYEDLEKR